MVDKSRPLRVLHVIAAYWPATRYGGPIRSSRFLVAAQVRAGHEVEVHTTDVDGEARADVPADGRASLDGAAIHYHPVAGGVRRRIRYSAAFLKALEERIPWADVVHSHGVFYYPGVVAAQIAAKHKKPFVVTPRGMLWPELIAEKNALIKRAWIAFLERGALKRTTVIHATTEREAEGVRALGLDYCPFEIVPNAVELPKIMPSEERVEQAWAHSPKGQRRLLHFGRVNWKKGIDLVIDALPSLENVHFTIAGHDDEGLGAKLLAQAERLGVRDRVHLLGAVDADAKWALLKGADLFALMSIDENFAIAAAEAMGAGTAALCAEGVGAGLIGQRVDPVCLVKREPEAILNGFRALLGDDARRERIGEQAAKLVATEYNWNKVAGDIEAFYRKILSERASHQAK